MFFIFEVAKSNEKEKWRGKKPFLFSNNRFSTIYCNLLPSSFFYSAFDSSSLVNLKFLFFFCDTFEIDDAEKEIFFFLVSSFNLCF